MTEDKAKTKWCPMTRSSTGSIGGTTSVNVVPNENGTPMRAKCIASGCMMWRQHRNDGEEYRLATGYCGLAGKD